MDIMFFDILKWDLINHLDMAAFFFGFGFMCATIAGALCDEINEMRS